ncbi:eukaryotic release factor 1 [Reticulomyxa filosa]|uniref:Eukaryotic release factor 1 n=1 Tax=Reticulomyxa filosa TaxID=46433 RepID=X6LSR8_RETFI|nr:eukaryotic release factor 1 [Reticulomyxa filosa]|eukprot:ETO04699.1 eukaryotic release factor 1 [Reticulomyxa filosa]
MQQLRFASKPNRVRCIAIALRCRGKCSFDTYCVLEYLKEELQWQDFSRQDFEHIRYPSQKKIEWRILFLKNNQLKKMYKIFNVKNNYGKKSDDSNSSEHDTLVKQCKIKNLIKHLSQARGNRTSMISLVILPKDQISRVQKMLQDSINIKSRVNRLSGLSTITSARERLKLYNKVLKNETCIVWENLDLLRIQIKHPINNDEKKEIYLTPKELQHSNDFLKGHSTGLIWEIVQ